MSLRFLLSAGLVLCLTTASAWAQDKTDVEVITNRQPLITVREKAQMDQQAYEATKEHSAAIPATPDEQAAPPVPAAQEEATTPSSAASANQLSQFSDETIHSGHFVVTSVQKCLDRLDPQDAIDIQMHSQTPYGDCLRKLSDGSRAADATTTVKKKKKKRVVIEEEGESDDEDASATQEQDNLPYSRYTSQRRQRHSTSGTYSNE